MKTQHFEAKRDIYDFSNTESLVVEEVIQMKYLMMSNEGGLSTREVTQIIDELEGIGGLMELAVGLGFLLFFLIVRPFTDLNLAVSFSALKTQICQ